MDNVSNSNMDTLYFFHFKFDTLIYPTNPQTDYQTHQWTMYPTVIWTHCIFHFKFDKLIYPTNRQTDYQTHDWTMYPTVIWTVQARIIFILNLTN